MLWATGTLLIAIVSVDTSCTLGYQPLYFKNNCVIHRDSCSPILCAIEVLSCLQDTRNWRQVEDAEVTLEQWSSTFQKLRSLNTVPLVVEQTINYFCWYFITVMLLLLWIVRPTPDIQDTPQWTRNPWVENHCFRGSDILCGGSWDTVLTCTYTHICTHNFKWNIILTKKYLLKK